MNGGWHRRLPSFFRFSIFPMALVLCLDWPNFATAGRGSARVLTAARNSLQRLSRFDSMTMRRPTLSLNRVVITIRITAAVLLGVLVHFGVAAAQTNAIQQPGGSPAPAQHSPSE